MSREWPSWARPAWKSAGAGNEKRKEKATDLRDKEEGGLEHLQGSASACIFSIKERLANAETKDNNSKWQEGKGILWLKVVVSWPQQAQDLKTEVRHGNESLSRLMAETLRKRKILGEGLRVKRKEKALPPTVTSVYPDAQDPRELGFLPVHGSSSLLPSPKHSSRLCRTTAAGAELG